MRLQRATNTPCRVHAEAAARGRHPALQSRAGGFKTEWRNTRAGVPRYPAYIYRQSGGLPGFIQVDRGAARPRTEGGRHRGLKLSMYSILRSAREHRNRDSRDGGAACDARRGEREMHLSEMSELEDMDGVSGLRQSYC